MFEPGGPIDACERRPYSRGLTRFTFHRAMSGEIGVPPARQCFAVEK